MTSTIELITTWNIKGNISLEKNNYKLSFGNLDIYSTEDKFEMNDIIRIKNMIDEFLWTFYTQHFLIDEFYCETEFSFIEITQYISGKIETKFMIPLPD